MTFRFTVTIEGADVTTAAAVDALFDAGCGDATVAASRGVQTASFDRVADEFADAVGTAIRPIESAVPGARVISIDRDHDVP
jgi:hypothetical protein